MYDQTKPLNAIAAIRVSTTKQGTEGDSPEAQREQIEQFAQSRNIKIKKIFSFLESASREQQPMQEAINYCKVRKNNVQLFIVKSIDRFTRLGSFTYSGLKSQLDNCDVRLMDIYGIIGAQKVNTLEHLGVSYKWSVYDPTKNSEILEAERASDEKRDIMSRMIGAQIRYTRLGYWMRRPLYGYTSEKVETPYLVTIATDEGPALGQPVWFLGYPFGIASHFNEGSIKTLPLVSMLPFVKRGTMSAFDATRPDAAVLYIDGFNNPGFSGGPILFWSFSKHKYEITGVVMGYREDTAKILINGQHVDTQLLVNSGILVGYSIGHAIEAIEKDEKQSEATK